MRRWGPLLVVVSFLLLGPFAGGAVAASPFGANAFVPVPDDPATSTVEAVIGANAADIDGDGDLDVVGWGYAEDGALFLLRNDGLGGLALLPAIALDRPATDVRAADLDGDGAVDLLVADDAGRAGVRWGDGTGAFGAPRALPGIVGALDATPVDVDHDGRFEIAVLTGSGVRVLARPAGRTSWVLRTSAPLPPQFFGRGRILARDLDGDRRPELVVSGYGWLEVLRNRAGRSFVPGWSEAVPGGYVTGLASGDLTGDGRTDLLVTVDGLFPCHDEPCAGNPPPLPSEMHRAELLAGDGAGRFTRLRSDSHSAPVLSPQIADFDGDGHADFAYTYSEPTDDCHGLVLETWRGIGQHAAGDDCSGYGTYASWLLAADLNGDRRADLIDSGPYDDGLSVHLTTPLPRTVTLPAREDGNDGFAGPVSAGGLRAGVAYDVTVQGTWSPWATSLYADPTRRFVTCGAADPLWRRAADAEWLFAAVAKPSCAGQVLPRRGGAFQLDAGTGFTHPTPIAQDARDHTYTYRVTGTGAPLRARLADANAADNSGALAISVREAAP